MGKCLTELSVPDCSWQDVSSVMIPTYEMWLKNNGTGRPADMAEDPQTIETHDINLQHIAMVRAK